ncbi:MAG: aminomethyl-transferring glycine dehydrogenase subunit GcvPB [Acidobacteriota bacterium]
MRIEEKLIFEKSRAGRVGYAVPSTTVDPVDPSAALGPYYREDIPGFPELSEPEVIRHFVNLSKLNYSIDEGMYPLGSCTMKYNPKINEKMAAKEGFAGAHPYWPPELVQGCLRVMKEVEYGLCDISGLDAFSLQPAAGAHGELTGMLMIRAYHKSRDENRDIVLIPDSAHGTNPSSAHIGGLKVQQIASNARGRLDVESLRKHLSPKVAALMITNPNTLGLFEDEIGRIAELLHAAGAQLYMDGANMNALLGKVRPGDFGVDVLHINLHKTFSTPHGGGGPGSGPVGVKTHLEPFLPVPVIVDEAGRLRLDYSRPESIGRVRAFYGNFGMVVRAYTYILSLGSEGMSAISEAAVLNANYLRVKLMERYHLAYEGLCMHESVFTDKRQAASGVTTMNIAKRLMDYGFHPPTVYFPLIVSGALMIEPTESEPLEELDRFVAVMNTIADEAQTNPDIVKNAPHTTPILRLDETRAARTPVLRWRPENR